MRGELFRNACCHLERQPATTYHVIGTSKIWWHTWQSREFASGASLEAADLYCHDERFEATYTHLILLQG